MEFSTERLPSATAPPAPKLAVLGTPLPRFHEVNPSSHQSYIESRDYRALTQAPAEVMLLLGRWAQLVIQLCQTHTP